MMRNCTVHNVRFYKPKPVAIMCMAFQKQEKLLALSRFDGSIEIWNLKYTCHLERRIAPTTDNGSIEGLVWSQNKLYSVGLHGLLVEYDVHKLCINNTSAVTGGSAYCLDGNKSQNELAIGTEQGYLNIFSVTDDGVMFSKFLDKQEGSILCLKYDHTEKFIVSGSPDAIRIWNVCTGHALHKMSTGRSEANKETIVWCLSVLSDFTIISGDSRGKLTFWDGHVGAQMESYQSHRADITSLCLSEDEDSLYCAGIDPVICNYVRISLKGTKKWVKNVQRKIHEHDVRSLVLYDNKLYSGGTDSYLTCSYHPPKTVIKFTQLLQNSCISLAREAKCILLRHSNHLEVWSLGETEEKENSKTGLLPVVKKPEKLVVLQKTVKTASGKEKKEGIVCSAISNNGKYVVYSWRSGTKLFELQMEDYNSPKLLNIDNFECNSCSLQAVFTPNNKQLILAQESKTIEIYTLKESLVEEKETLDISKDLEDPVTFLTVSSCSEYLVAADPLSNIVIWTSKNKKWTKYCKLPRYKAGPVALSINPKNQRLVVAYADNKIIEYDIKKRAFTDFSKLLDENFPDKLSNRNYPIRNITFDEKNENVIMLHDDSNLMIINKEKELAERETKLAKLDQGEKKEDCFFRNINKYKHLVHLDWLNEEEMIVVEVPPLSILEKLPPCLIQKKFGRK